MGEAFGMPAARDALAVKRLRVKRYGLKLWVTGWMGLPGAAWNAGWLGPGFYREVRQVAGWCCLAGWAGWARGFTVKCARWLAGATLAGWAGWAGTEVLP